MTLRVVAIPLFAAICLASPAVTSGEQAKKGRGYSPRESGGGQTATRSGGTPNRGGGDRDRGASTASRPAGRRADGGSADRDSGSQRTARPRDTGGAQTAARSGDDRRGRTATADNTGGEQRRRDTPSSRGDAGERYAVPRTSSAVVNRPRIATRDVRPGDYRDSAYYRVVRNDWPRINVNIGSSRRGGHYAPVHYDYWARRYYRWSPIRYAPWSLIYGSIGFSNYGFYGGVGPSPFYYGYNGHGYSYGSGIYSPYGGYPAYNYPHVAGGVRLKIRPRDAEVFVDGYYAGRVDDFDGVFQSLKLEAGGHKIEVRMPGFEDLEVDVHIQPGRTLTLEEFLQPRP